jgi:hypothetical protein
VANGYELAYRRLAELPFLAERWDAAHRCIQNVRVTTHEFRLLVSSDETPEVTPLFKLAADCRTFGEPVVDIRYSGEPNIWNLVHDKYFDQHCVQQFVRAAYGRDVQPVFPCDPEVIVEGRNQGRGKKYQQSFASWWADQFIGDRGKWAEKRSQELRARIDEIMDTAEFLEGARVVLEDLAVADLADKMLHYSKIPNVIKRAAELFVVADVMGS